MNSKIFSGQVTYLENWRSSIFCTISCQQVSTFRFEQSFWLSEQFRAVFSFVLGTNEDGFEAPEGLHYRHIRQIYPNQRSVHNYVAIITEPFSSSSPFRAARQAGYCAGCVRAGHRLALLSKSSYGRGKMGACRIFFYLVLWWWHLLFTIHMLCTIILLSPHSQPPSQQFRW